MSTPRDDDALSWGGDDDPTLDVGDKRAPEHPSGAGPEPLLPVPRPEPLVPEPALSPAERAPAAEAPVHETAVEAPVESAPDDTPSSRSAAPLGNAGLVGIGMVAATFLLFAVGWLLAGRQLQGLGIPIPDVTVVAMTIGATLAPIVWFVAVLVLTRGWRTWQRFLLLILGIVLLVPWPFLSMGSLA